jgi:hypothetical protein
MPRIVGPGSRTIRLSIIAVVVLFAFTPISRALLASADGSFAPTPYSSLALRTTAGRQQGFPVGDLVPVRLTNRTGSTRTYHWEAVQRGVVVSLGELTVRNGGEANINVSTTYASIGKLTIAIAGSDVFVTASIVKS